jgi:hypothetical protein
MAEDRLERFRRAVHGIVGVSVPAAQLVDLLGLASLSPPIVTRYFQTRARIQLKKGQSVKIVQAFDALCAEPAAQLPGRSAPLSSNDDPDLTPLATVRGQALAKVLRDVLREVHFDQVNHDLRLPRYGGDYDLRPFPLPTSPVDIHEMKVRLRNAVKSSRTPDDAAFARRIQRAFALFMFGQALTRQAVEELVGSARKAIIDDALAVGLFVRADGDAVRMNGLSLFSTRLVNGQALHLFADTPPHFETRAVEQRVYAGADSYELLAKVAAIDSVSGVCVEMGSGSGIQLIGVLKQHPAVSAAIGVEQDRRALHVSLFNAALNGVDEKMRIVQTDDALALLLDGRSIAFAMTNPPFIAMPAWIDIDAADSAAVRPLMDSRETDRGRQGDLRTIFPRTGWGGEDGLAVTKVFIDRLFPFLDGGSRTVIYSQFAGDRDGPRVLQDYIRSRGGFHFEFEPVKTRALMMRQQGSGGIAVGENRTVLAASDAAASVARLIVAALLARENLDRVRVAVRRGGREDGWQSRFAARIGEFYRLHGISHFHDGFAVLTKDDAP